MKTQLLQILILIFSLVLLNESVAQKPVNENLFTLKNTEYEFKDKTNNNKSFNSSTYLDGQIEVTEMMTDYLFPSSIDESGNHVIIQVMGNALTSYYWSEGTGVVEIDGEAKNIANNLSVSGNYLEFNFNGSGEDAEVAGFYDLNSQDWTFLGFNNDNTNIISGSYNTSWDLSDDGTKVVGLQWTNSGSAIAYSWSEETGYDNIGDVFSGSSRASGISRNGEVIFGWSAQTDGTWTPTIWHNDTYTQLTPGDVGDVSCASPNGSIVSGRAANEPFIWTEEDGIENFGTMDDYPQVIMDNGAVYGLNKIYPPQDRRAFYRNVDGEMINFNDYMESKGMENAQDWIFYSINDVTPNEKIFIGVGRNPAGIDVAFRMEIIPEGANALNLISNPTEAGILTGGGYYEEFEEITVSAEANEYWTFVNWTDEDGQVISTNTEYSFTMPDEEVTLTANFEIDASFELTLIATPEEGGTVYGGGNYALGQQVYAIASPNDGYDFLNWTNENGNIVSTNVTYSFTMPIGDMTLTANFDIIDNVSDLNNGAISIYPNPANESIQLDGIKEKVYCNIYAIDGRLIIQKELNESNNLVDLSFLNTGSYFITLQGKNTKFQQIIKKL